MVQDYFNQRKQAILNKKDKSGIGEWDEKIKKLCDLINEFPQYYTTSSCAGRIVLIKDKDKKGKGLFFKQYHNKISLNELKKDLELIKENKDFSDNLVKFKQEPLILHVACRTLKDANHLMKIAQKSGIKKVGIITLDNRPIVEINGSEKIEFPIFNKGALLVDDQFLKILVKKTNYNLEKNWEKIKILEEKI